MKIRKTNKVSVAQGCDYLELGVIPRSDFLQRLSRFFRKPAYLKDHRHVEIKLNEVKHRLELIRTIATSCNTIISIFVLLRVFGILK